MWALAKKTLRDEIQKEIKWLLIDGGDEVWCDYRGLSMVSDLSEEDWKNMIETYTDQQWKAFFESF